MTKENSLVSIIIPTYNRGSLIGETLDSILGQTYTNWECIVVDDGSFDHTAQIIKDFVKKDARFQYHQRPTNRLKGANACRNYGFELSKGAFIQWFDSDDIMHKDKLKYKVSSLENSIFDFVVCEGLEFRDDINNVICKWDKISSNEILFDHITGKVNFCTNGPLFKKVFLERIVLLNEKLQRKQEWEFFTRLLTISSNYKPIHKSLYYIRNHENSINGQNDIKTLKSRIYSNKLVFESVKKHLNNEQLNIIRKEFLNKYIYFFKLANKAKKTRLIIFSIWCIFFVLTPKMFLESMGNIVKKPYLIIKIFK